MAGRITKSDEQLRPDPRFNSKVLSKFINCVMLEGRKTSATRAVYDAIDIIQKRLDKENNPDAPKEAFEVFTMAIDNVKPPVEVRSKRIGGANYQVPMQVNRKRQQSLSMRWILNSVRGEKGRPFARRLADELYNAARGEGKAMSTREQTIRMAEANRAFAHFAGPSRD
ncbi:MAG: 30S ribosomal protein S7 [Phycisphaeraceae bacterium]|nr:MAG: 30S ribosomal protein S7 [Phycisphaeraceae bacterium]